MDFSLARELSEIREAVRALCDRFPGEYWRGLEPDRYPEEFVTALTENGWLAALIPEEYGGAGLSSPAASVILEEINALGRQRRRLPCADVHHGHDPAARLARSRSSATCPKIATGELRLQAFGVTEPTPAPTRRSIQTTARSGPTDGYVIRRPEDLDVARPALGPDAAARADDAADRVEKKTRRPLDLHRRHAQGAGRRD